MCEFWLTFGGLWKIVAVGSMIDHGLPMIDHGPRQFCFKCWFWLILCTSLFFA
ncbi:hypothetical protein LguiA_028914 [Lonicera macranthoides]